MTRWRRRAGERESRRARRRRVVGLLRSQGRYGPEFREVLPVLAGLVLALSGAVAGVAAAYRALGIGVPLAVLALAAVAVPVLVRRHRPSVRRRLGYYTAEEIADLDVAGLALAVARMLRRDGWSVRFPAGERVRPRLQARRGDGQRLEVAFRPVAEPLPDEDPPAPPARRPGDGPPLRLIVHRGAFGPRDVRWTRADGSTRLMDGALLSRWAGGTPLHRLIDLR
ncbi:hypothetical protein [Streptomyces glaucus]|uniref:hypothetical protein n=1 Tax=Streptomyces glaucus TaxID=284029 RepID=UPI0031D73332